MTLIHIEELDLWRLTNKFNYHECYHTIYIMYSQNKSEKLSAPMAVKCYPLLMIVILSFNVHTVARIYMHHAGALTRRYSVIHEWCRFSPVTYIVRKVWCVRTENAQDGICNTQDLVRDLIPDVWVVYVMCIGKFMYKGAFCLLVWNQAV